MTGWPAIHRLCAVYAAVASHHSTFPDGNPIARRDSVVATRCARSDASDTSHPPQRSSALGHPGARVLPAEENARSMSLAARVASLLPLWMQENPTGDTR